MRSELGQLRLSELNQRAIAAGADPAALSAALDAEQPRDAVIALLLEKVLANGIGAAPPAAPAVPEP